MEMLKDIKLIMERGTPVAITAVLADGCFLDEIPNAPEMRTNEEDGSEYASFSFPVKMLDKTAEPIDGKLPFSTLYVKSSHKTLDDMQDAYNAALKVIEKDGAGQLGGKEIYGRFYSSAEGVPKLSIRLSTPRLIDTTRIEKATTVLAL